MSDTHFRLIPADPHWQPDPAAAEAATAFVTGLFSGPQDEAEHIEALFHDRIELIDAGEYAADTVCPRCGRTTSIDWLYDLTRRSFDPRDVTVPCCGARLPVDDLGTDSPIGFARFVIDVLNPVRLRNELDPSELDQLGTILGHPVRQIIAHY